MIKWLTQKGFFHLLSANFLMQFLGFGSQLLVAKFLTPVELGEIKILQSYTAIFTVLAGFGYNTAVLKICSENRSSDEKNAIFRVSLIRSLLTTTAALLILATLSISGLITSSRHLSIWLIIYALVVPFVVANSLLSTFLQAKKQIREMARAQTIIRAQSFIVIVFSAWRWGFAGFVISTILAYAIGLVPLMMQIGTGFLRSRAISMPQEFNNIAILGVVANGISTIGLFTDIFILDHFSVNRAQVGYYSLATIFFLGAMQITATVQSIVTPYFSEHWINEKWMRGQLHKNQLRLVALSIVVAFAIWALAAILVPAIYGSKYQPVMIFLPVLMLRYILWSAAVVPSSAIFGLGKIKYNLYAAAICTPVGIATSYIFLKQLGIVGVAWAQCVTALLGIVLTYIYTHMALVQTYRKP